MLLSLATRRALMGLSSTVLSKLPPLLMTLERCFKSKRNTQIVHLHVDDGND